MGCFCELWSSVLSIDLMGPSEVIDWAVLAALFSSPEERCSFLAVCLGSLSCWKVHPCFILIILVDGCVFPSRMALYILPFILSLIMWNFQVPYADKQLLTMMFAPPNFTVGVAFWGDACAICAPEFPVWTHLVRLYSQYFTGSSES